MEVKTSHPIQVMGFRDLAEKVLAEYQAAQEKFVAECQAKKEQLK